MEKRKTSILSNGFGKMWLGNLVHKLGGNWKELRCRGEITEFSLDGNVLTINQETAWCEQEGVRQIIEKTYPSIQVYFMEQEPGCGVFYTNDASGDYFPERYFLDSYEDWEYFETLDEAADFVSKIVGSDVEPSVNAIQNALDAYVENTKKRMKICFIHSTSLRFVMINKIGKKAFYRLSSLFFAP